MLSINMYSKITVFIECIWSVVHTLKYQYSQCQGCRSFSQHAKKKKKNCQKSPQKGSQNCGEMEYSCFTGKYMYLTLLALDYKLQRITIMMMFECPVCVLRKLCEVLLTHS